MNGSSLNAQYWKFRVGLLCLSHSFHAVYCIGDPSPQRTSQIMLCKHFPLSRVLISFTCWWAVQVIEAPCCLYGDWNKAGWGIYRSAAISMRLILGARPSPVFWLHLAVDFSPRSYAHPPLPSPPTSRPDLYIFMCDSYSLLIVEVYQCDTTVCSWTYCRRLFFFYAQNIVG